MRSRLKYLDREIAVEIVPHDGETWKITFDDKTLIVRGQRLSPTHIVAQIGGRTTHLHVQRTGQGKSIAIESVLYPLQDISRAPKRRAGAEDAAQDITPPMPGVITKVLVEPGALVAKGQGLVVMTAMKMETTLSASAPALVSKILVKVGEQVMPGQKLVELAPAPKSASAAPSPKER